MGLDLGTRVLLTAYLNRAKVSIMEARTLNSTQADRLEVDGSADDEKVIPWAEGNGLWSALERLVINLTAVDIVTFLVDNPYTCDSAGSIAMRIGRPVYRVEPILQELAMESVLHAVDLADVRVYSLPEDPQQRQTMQQYVSWLREGYHWARMTMEP
jgi:hypothetical protein